MSASLSVPAVLSPPPDPLADLSMALEELGLQTRVDRPSGFVDARIPDVVALAGCYGRGEQRVLLRPAPVTRHLWWYLYWPAEQFRFEVAPFELEKLCPVNEVTEMARLVRRVLVLVEPEVPR